jgi:Fur family ferric uptake transcriptional regulator
MKQSTSVETMKAPWRDYLRRKHLKTTQQREAIVDAFLRSTGHVALEDLLSSARKRNPGVGLATVYRTVKLLEEAGLAHARQFGSGHTLYEVAGQRAHHDHLICQQCDHIIEFESDEIETIQERVARRLGFNITHHRHEIFGLCEKAQGVPGGVCPADRLKKR